MDGRVERRVEAMRRAQVAALDLFESRGFSAVTVEEIAAQAGVGPATVYRNFGTKERLVLWDDYDPQLLSALRERLPCDSPMAAVLAALVASVDHIYADDKQRILRRTRLVLAEPSIAAAAALDHTALVRSLSEAFRERGAFGGPLERDVAAGAIAAALEAAVIHWTQQDGRSALRHFLERAFATLTTLR